ncbi:hypothetical protein HMPREF2796_10280 [Eikenella sp. HMSC071B05]|nr:hypothetical protein HMPREF2796_10280 [Eikenella sp. HMSC071B05]OFO44338.1 hypothetical protein HMPREF3043_09955 [Eikenella sp. HMSC073A11]
MVASFVWVFGVSDCKEDVLGSMQIKQYDKPKAQVTPAAGAGSKIAAINLSYKLTPTIAQRQRQGYTSPP